MGRLLQPLFTLHNGVRKIPVAMCEISTRLIKRPRECVRSSLFIPLSKGIIKVGIVNQCNRQSRRARESRQRSTCCCSEAGGKQPSTIVGGHEVYLYT